VPCGCQQQTGGKAEQAQAQILHEMQRRDETSIRRHDRALEHKRRLVAKRLAHAKEIDRAWLEAESATRGNMVNKAGEAGGSTSGRYSPARMPGRAGTRPRNCSITGSRSTGRQRRSCGGKDTRLGPQYTAPRRRRPVVTAVRSLPARAGASEQWG
jgi:hypothetical protein